jgi:hypothetical protein
MEKGKFMTYREYVAAKDGPYKASHIRNKVGSWKLVERLIARHYPEEYAFIKSEQDLEEEEVVILDIPKKGQENEEEYETKDEDE